MAAVVTPELFEFINRREQPDRLLCSRIDDLSLSADAKALLHQLLEWSTRVGEASLRIGRKLLDFVLAMLTSFPHLSFTTLFAAVLAALISAAPLLGPLLSPIVTPLLLALGVAVGGFKELADPALGERVQAFAARFQALQ